MLWGGLRGGRHANEDQWRGRAVHERLFHASECTISVRMENPGVLHGFSTRTDGSIPRMRSSPRGHQHSASISGLREDSGNADCVLGAGAVITAFEENPCTWKRLASLVKGMQQETTSDFLRHWPEVSKSWFRVYFRVLPKREEEERWFPYNKGGGYRKWYGNLEFV